MTLAGSAPPPSPDEVQARLDRLEAENAHLRSAVRSVDGGSSRAKGAIGRAFLSALCIVLASVLVPTAIVAAGVRVQLVDETTFVATLAPLIDDPAVQSVIISEASAAITSRVDLTGITDDFFDGIATLDLPPRALSSLDLLRGPAAQALDDLVTSTVTRVVTSDAFSDLWRSTLTASHRALVATAAGGTTNGAVTISDSGEVGIQLGPIIEAVRQRLIDQGVGFASAIPTIDRTIVIVRNDQLATVGVVYALAAAVGWWLPFLTLALFAIGVLVARRRGTALLGVGIALALSGLALAAGLGVGGTILGLSAGDLGVPAAALTAIYSAVVGAMQHTAAVTVVAGVIIAALAWVSGRWRGARAVRAGVSAVNDAIRGTVAARGVDTGRFGTWMWRQRVLVRVTLGVLAMLWLVLLRPLGAADVFLVVIVGALAWWLTELVQNRTAPQTADAESPRRADAAAGADAP